MLSISKRKHDKFHIYLKVLNKDDVGKVGCVFVAANLNIHLSSITQELFYEDVGWQMRIVNHGNFNDWYAFGNIEWHVTE